MKLTNRERILIPAALLIIATALFINFIYLPLNNEISALKTTVEENELLINEAETKQGAIRSLEDKLSSLQESIKTEHQDVLQEWDQAELLAFIDDTIDPMCSMQSIDFYDVTSLQAIQAGEVNIVFTADYSSIKEILGTLENAKYYNSITLLDIHEPEKAVADTSDTKKQLEVSMNIRFYSRNLNSNYPQNYSFMNGEYGKTEIFE